MPAEVKAFYNYTSTSVTKQLTVDGESTSFVRLPIKDQLTKNGVSIFNSTDRQACCAYVEAFLRMRAFCYQGGSCKSKNIDAEETRTPTINLDAKIDTLDDLMASSDLDEDSRRFFNYFASCNNCLECFYSKIGKAVVNRLTSIPEGTSDFFLSMKIPSGLTLNKNEYCGGIKFVEAYLRATVFFFPNGVKSAYRAHDLVLKRSSDLLPGLEDLPQGTVDERTRISCLVNDCQTQAFVCKIATYVATTIAQGKTPVFLDLEFDFPTSLNPCQFSGCVQYIRGYLYQSASFPLY